MLLDLSVALFGIAEYPDRRRWILAMMMPTRITRKIVPKAAQRETSTVMPREWRGPGFYISQNAKGLGILSNVPLPLRSLTFDENS
jgi:hypothetical protein